MKEEIFLFQVVFGINNEKFYENLVLSLLI